MVERHVGQRCQHSEVAVVPPAKQNRAQTLARKHLQTLPSVLMYNINAISTSNQSHKYASSHNPDGRAPALNRFNPLGQHCLALLLAWLYHGASRRTRAADFPNPEPRIAFVSKISSALSLRISRSPRPVFAYKPPTSIKAGFRGCPPSNSSTSPTLSPLLNPTLAMPRILFVFSSGGKNLVGGETGWWVSEGNCHTHLRCTVRLSRYDSCTPVPCSLEAL